MAGTLKSQYGEEIPRRVAEMLRAVYPAFDRRRFLRIALEGYEALELMPRARQISTALQEVLPADYEAAAEILISSLGPKLTTFGQWGMAPFVYLPHVFFVAERGTKHFEVSMRLQYELTQRFTAEFSIRTFLEHYPERTLRRLRSWACDPSAHVRRLVSEGTRPRLPWAPRLRRFQQDPTPVLELLELLKDDPELYVRRSVANNLNDIGKDHPELLFRTLARWQRKSCPQRTWIVRHALRSAVKRGERGALELIGVAATPKVRIDSIELKPKRVKIGSLLNLSFELSSLSTKPQELLIDLEVGYVKARGERAPKVFKLKEISLQPKERIIICKKLPFRQLTTRELYPGTHSVALQINGRKTPLGTFELVK